MGEGGLGMMQGAPQEGHVSTGATWQQIMHVLQPVGSMPWWIQTRMMQGAGHHDKEAVRNHHTCSNILGQVYHLQAQGGVGVAA